MLPISISYSELKMIYEGYDVDKVVDTLTRLPGVKFLKCGRGHRITIDYDCPEAMIHVLYWATFHERKKKCNIIKYLSFNLAQSLRRRYMESSKGG